MLSGQQDHSLTACAGDAIGDGDGQLSSRTRTRGSATHPTTNGHAGNHIEGYNALDEMEDESDATSSGGGWDGGDDDEVDAHIVDDDDDDDVDMSDSKASADEEEEDDLIRKQSLVVSLRYQKTHGSSNTEEPSKGEPSIKINGLSGAPTSPGDSAPRNPKLAGNSNATTNHQLPSTNHTPLTSSLISSNDGHSTTRQPGQQPNGSSAPSLALEPSGPDATIR